MSVSKLLQDLIETTHYVGKDWEGIDDPPEGWLPDTEEDEDEDEDEDMESGGLGPTNNLSKYLFKQPSGSEVATECACEVMIDLPDVGQPDSISCGAAVSMSVGMYYGVGPKTLEEWEQLLGTNEEIGTSTQGIVDGLRGLGLEVVELSNMTLDDLWDCVFRRIPVIVLIQEYGERGAPIGFEDGHWVAVIGIGLGQVFVQDPNVDNVFEDTVGDETPGRMMISETKFLEVWQGIDDNGKEVEGCGIVVGQKSMESHVEKANCEQGETAAKTDCTPAEGNGGSESSSSDSGTKEEKPSSTKLTSEFKGIKSTKQHLKEVASKIGNKVWSKLPTKIQNGLAYTWAKAKWIEHKAMSGFRNSRDLASELGEQWGLSESNSKRLGATLGFLDLATAWTINPAVGAMAGTALGGPAGGVLGAKAAAWTPVFSLGFIATSSALNPWKTMNAAKSLVAKHKSRNKMLDKEDPKSALAQRLGEMDDTQTDWYLGLLSNALDSNQGDLKRSLIIADELIKAYPVQPETDGLFMLEGEEGPKDNLPK